MTALYVICAFLALACVFLTYRLGMLVRRIMLLEHKLHAFLVVTDGVLTSHTMAIKEMRGDADLMVQRPTQLRSKLN